MIRNVEGLTLTVLFFDTRDGGQCTARNQPTDVVHAVGGRNRGTTQPSPAMGWKRLRFDPSNPPQSNPPNASGTQVKSIYLVRDDGPVAGGGLGVRDNVNVNGVFIGQE